MTATSRDELKATILAELRCRPAGQGVDIPALVEDHGAGVLAALKELRRERRVRLVAIGGGLTEWLAENGYARDAVIDGEGEVFVAAEAV